MKKKEVIPKRKEMLQIGKVIIDGRFICECGYEREGNLFHLNFCPSCGKKIDISKWTNVVKIKDIVGRD